LPATTFATLLYAEIEARAGTLRLWNAGHPPALIWRARDGHVESASCGQAPPLGLFAIWRAPEQELTLAPGDLLILHSDGITEARTQRGQSYFDEARLLEIIRAHAPHGPEALADAVFAALHEGGVPGDDLTLLLCQRNTQTV
jgi:sigma-B regulation protein RsbU (phosphoserine phosphatase)